MRSLLSFSLILASACPIAPMIIGYAHDLRDPQQQHTNKDSIDATVEASQQPTRDAGSTIDQTISTATTPVVIPSLVKEAKDAIFDPSSKLDSEHASEGASPNTYIDMGGMGSWVEFHVDHDGVTSTTCKLSFHYANGASNRHRRPCSVSVNGKLAGTLYFPSTISWSNWSYAQIEVKDCIISGKKNTKIRLTATTEEGGPNIDSMEWTTKLSDAHYSPTLSSSPTYPELNEKETKWRKCNYQYDKLPEGQITYGLDDGGCFFCVQEHPINSKTSTKVPSSGKALIEQCQSLCDDDSQCLAFTVARAQSLHPQLYRFGTRSNCCLERTKYPPGAYLRAPPTTTTMDGKNIRTTTDRRNDCQLDAKCWTRYEKNLEKESCADFGSSEDVTAPNPSTMTCSRVWEPTTYTDDEVQTTIDFINDGCRYSDDTYMSMLAWANARCAEEILAESLAVSIIVHSSGMMTYVTVGQLT